MLFHKTLLTSVCSQFLSANICFRYLSGRARLRATVFESCEMASHCSDRRRGATPYQLGIGVLK